MTKPDYQSLLICKNCDLLLRRPRLNHRDRAHCPRCGCRLAAPHKNGVERALAVAISGLLLMLPANLLPLLSMDILGREQVETLPATAQSLIEGQLYIPAMAIILFAIVIPGVKLYLLAYVSAALYLRQPWPNLAFSMRCYQHLDEWSMLEVFLLAIFIAVVKLLDLATVTPGVGLYSLAVVILFTTRSSVLVDPDDYWQKIEAVHEQDSSLR